VIDNITILSMDRVCVYSVPEYLMLLFCWFVDFF
jgi:hypothetical protein